MADASQAIYSLDELRTYVHQTLCARENLLPDQSPLSEAPLTRGGRRCGLQFCVQGPRSVRLTGIWVTDENVLYFYDARGERFQKVALRYRISFAA